MGKGKRNDEDHDGAVADGAGGGGQGGSSTSSGDSGAVNDGAGYCL